ncbi:chaperonin 10-like protein [Podospora didyma]|uniref:Chaperonin 10-like protein n=1 Tax=Podospora didyma TaxID=330526 RepID=A0AAE0NZK3_9PEZI|nr:chaperonin 10-like protein [Podospora didyma]
MSLPKTYKHAVFKTKGGPLILEDAPLQLPSAGELLIKVEACGVCHSDIYAQYDGVGGGFPVTPGHEIIGRVVAVGSGAEAQTWKVGDRIGSGWHGGHDGTCKACKQGFNQMCDNQLVNGITKAGGYAEYCLLRAEASVHVPDNVDAATYAPILCAGVTVFNSIRHMNIPAGATVAVQGLGGLGHLAIQYTRRMGYRVIAISRGADKEKAARALGANDYINCSEGGDPGSQLKAFGDVSLIISTAAAAEAISPLVKGLGILGKLLVLSIPGDLTVDTYAMVNKGLSVYCWPSGHAGDSEDAIQFTQINNVECAIEKFSLSDVQNAYDAMINGTVHFRAVLTMD